MATTFYSQPTIDTSKQWSPVKIEDNSRMLDSYLSMSKRLEDSIKPLILDNTNSVKTTSTSPLVYPVMNQEAINVLNKTLSSNPADMYSKIMDEVKALQNQNTITNDPTVGYSWKAYNNPGNIKLKYGAGFQKFKNMPEGIRAVGNLLTRYFSDYGVKNLREAVYKYAPPIENDSASYANFLAEKTGLDIDDTNFNYRDLNELSRAVRGFLYKETGKDFGLNYVRNIIAGE